MPLGYGLYRLLQWLTLTPARVEVTPSGLRVRTLPDGRELAVAFVEVKSCRDMQLRDGHELRLQLHSGKKIKLAVNSFLGPIGDYNGLVRATQSAVTHHNSTAATLIVRERSFMEKPAATVLLVACSAVLLLSTGQLVMRHQAPNGSFFVALSTWLSYLGMWYNARRGIGK